MLTTWFTTVTRSPVLLLQSLLPRGVNDIVWITRFNEERGIFLWKYTFKTLSIIRNFLTRIFQLKDWSHLIFLAGVPRFCTSLTQQPSHFSMGGMSSMVRVKLNGSPHLPSTLLSHSKQSMLWPAKVKLGSELGQHGIYNFIITYREFN